MAPASVRSACRDFWLDPPQVPDKLRGPVRVAGQLGWLAKAFVYASLGGLLCRGAASDDVQHESPQAVFLLVGSFPIGKVWLSALALGVAIYATWRLVEGVLGQGYSSSASTFSNLFRFRVSPLTSGAVYIAYLVFLCKVLFQVDSSASGNDQQEGIPSPAMCFLLGTAFLAATIAQLVQTFRHEAQFCQELDPAMTAQHPRLTFFVKALGRVGFAGRAVLFMLISVLYWKAVAGSLSREDYESTGSNMARALRTLHGSAAGRGFLFVLGVALLLYGIFALANVRMRSFPTVATRRRPLQLVVDANALENGERTPLHAAVAVRDVSPPQLQPPRQAAA